MHFGICRDQNLFFSEERGWGNGSWGGVIWERVCIAGAFVFVCVLR
jgi:hypothetical protein